MYVAPLADLLVICDAKNTSELPFENEPITKGTDVKVIGKVIDPLFAIPQHIFSPLSSTNLPFVFCPKLLFSQRKELENEKELSTM